MKLPYGLQVDPADLAAMDQQQVDVRHAVERLIAGPPLTDDDPLLVYVELIHRIAAAAVSLTDDADEPMDGRIVAIAAELLRRALTTNQGAPTA